MSDHECYLCGAQNDPSASFCSRCNGQLLRLGPEPESESVAPEPEVVEVEESKGPDNFSRLRQLRRKSTLDDSRLSDALGLQDEPIEGLPEARVSAVPKAQTATDIPIIGTLPGSGSGGLRNEAPSRRLFVLLGLLVLAVAWLAWSTLGSSSSSPQAADEAPPITTPTTFPTTTTTEAPIREWTESEVDSQFGDAMVNVQLILCAGGAPTTVQTSGINIDAHTTLIDISPLPDARSARIFTPLGSNRPAVITTRSNGSTIAVSPVRGVDHLRLGEQPVGETRFQLDFDPTVNQLEIETVAPGVQLSGPGTELLVTNQGEAVEARIAGRTLDFAELQESIDTVVSVEGANVSPGDPCTWPGALAFASGDSAAPSETLTDEDETPEQESPDPQETDQ